ncbi:MAG: leucyl aminopeptidase family protein [Caulobacteraceae bacterium]
MRNDSPLLAEAHSGAAPIWLVASEAWSASDEPAGPTTAGAGIRETARRLGFAGRAGDLAVVPNRSGEGVEVLFGVDNQAGAMALRALPALLPGGVYRLADDLGNRSAAWGSELVPLAWALGAYRFDRYRSELGASPRPLLATGLGTALPDVQRVADACAWARDMINAPANVMDPPALESEARAAADRWGAAIRVVRGDALLDAGYPLVHAVGRAAGPAAPPRMLEVSWGDPDHPVLAVVGKGVTFDSGGLDLKPGAGMRLMKKDMGGAAHALALGQLIVGARLPVRLVILIPAVENAVSGGAYRPGDILRSRAGPTVEIGNTDAEGRLILADALARAGELAPRMTIDLATLTGAARVALGPQIAPFFTADDRLAEELLDAGREVEDPLWRMPLWEGYAAALDSDVADLKNDPDQWAQAGCVAAALFLRRFAPTSGVWAHFDIFAWNPRGRPGFPVGAEVQAVRALLRVIQARFS